MGQPPDLLKVCGVVVVTIELRELVVAAQVLGPGPHARQVRVELRPEDVNPILRQALWRETWLLVILRSYWGRCDHTVAGVSVLKQMLIFVAVVRVFEQVWMC